MTLALAHYNPAPIQPPRTGQWIEIAEAARRANKSPGHIRRECGRTFKAQGLARETMVNGRLVWQVHESAHPDFARVKSADQIGTDLSGFTEAKRQIAYQRKALLDLWERAVAEAFTQDIDRLQATLQFLQRLQIERGQTISQRTLYRWHAGYRARGLEGLVDLRGHEPEKIEAAEDPFLLECRRLYLSGRHKKQTLIHELACALAADRGWRMHSIHAVRRYLATIPAPQRVWAREGPKAFKDKIAGHLSRDYTTLAANEVWESDHHEFDVIVQFGARSDTRTGEIRAVYGRPWLTSWMDLRSRKIVGYVICRSPNTDSILAALDRAVRARGVPESVHVDNGKDYDSAALQGLTKQQRQKYDHARKLIDLDPARIDGVFGALSVRVTHAPPYHPQSKTIERWHRTVTESWCATWETYTGRSSAHKPHDLQKHLEDGHAPSFEDFAAATGQWIEDGYNASHAHSGQGMDGQTPDWVFAQCLQTKRTAPSELLDVLLLRPVKVKIQRGGTITYQGLVFEDQGLYPLIGKPAVLRVDDNDLSKVQVYDAAGKFLCIAGAKARLPANADRETLREAIRQKRADAKLHRSYHEQRPTLHEDLPERLRRLKAQKARDAQAANPQPPAPHSRPVRSPLEDQLPALQRALRPHRLAAGGEHQPDPADLTRLAGAFSQAARQATPQSDAADADDSDAFVRLADAFRTRPSNPEDES